MQFEDYWESEISVMLYKCLDNQDVCIRASHKIDVTEMFELSRYLSTMWEIIEKFSVSALIAQITKMTG